MVRYRTQNRNVLESWRSQAPATRLIRFWLGVTWIYAGWDKATDSGFLTEGSSSFIGKQLIGYSTQVPFDFLFNKLIEYSVAVGIIVLLSEFVIGLATLLWIAPTTAALAGFSMSVGLWIATTLYVKPYFLGSDTAYAVLWLSYFLTLVGNRRNLDLSLDRRGLMRAGTVGAIAVIASGVGRIFARERSTLGRSSVSGKKLVKVADLELGATHEFALGGGTPAILFRTKSGVFAYSAICTHQGCTVAYNSASKILQCPCHGSEYDPFSEAKVLRGPAINPLSKINVGVDEGWVILR